MHLQDVHRSCFHQGTSQRTQEVTVLVKSFRIVACIDAHRLLTHRRLIGVSWRLIVVRQRNAACHMTNNQARVNLVVCMLWCCVLFGNRNVKCLGLRRINVFNTALHPSGPIGTHSRPFTASTEHRSHQSSCIRLNDDGVEKCIPGDGSMWM